MKLHLFKVLVFCLAYSLNSSAQLYVQLEKADSLAGANELSESIKLINEVLEAKPRNFLKSQAYYQLSYVYLQLYNLDKALDYNQQSLKIRDRLQYEFVADNYMRFGTIELLQGNLETALKYFLEARELPHADLQFSGILDGYIGATYERLDQPVLALENYRTSLEVLGWELDSNHPDISVAQYNLGNFHAGQGNTGEAIKHYEKSILIELTSNWEADSNPRLARAYNALGQLVLDEKMDFEEAKKLFEGAMIASKGYRRLMAKSILNLAHVSYRERAFETASEQINSALVLLNPDEEEELQFFIPMVLDKKLYASGLQLKSQILLEEYETNRKKESLSLALENSILAIEVFEQYLLAPYQADKQLELLQNEKDVYEQTIYLSMKLLEVTGDTKYLDTAFQYAERGKAIVLKNQMQQFYGMLKDRLPETIQKEEERIRNQLTFFETDLAVKYKADNFRKEVLSLNRAYETLLKDIEKSAPEYFGLRYHLSKVSIPEVQTKLEEKEVLLSYYQGAELYYIFAINKDGAEGYYSMQNAPLPEKGKVGFGKFKKKTEAQFPVPNQNGKKPDLKLPKPDVGIYTQYTEEELAFKSIVNKGLKSTIGLSKKQFVAANYILYQKLIEPIKSTLNKKKKLIVVAHGDLHFATFETLLKEKPKKKIKYHKLKYLIKDYAVSYELSSDFLLERTSSNARTIQSIAAFAPVFNPADDFGYTLNTTDLLFDTIYATDEELRSITPDRKSFKMLKHSETEVVSTLKLFAKEGREGKAYLKKDASEQTFKEKAGQYDLLHLASHSFVNATNPKLSGIALIPSAKEDGVLFAGEVMNLDLRKTFLVVLSSCESGTGSLIPGEGLLSLNRAFRFAGTKNNLSTRWKISDKATSKLMVYFYKKILDGADYSEALRYAKLKMIKKSKTAIPKLWAGFALTGS